MNMRPLLKSGLLKNWIRNRHHSRQGQVQPLPQMRSVSPTLLLALSNGFISTFSRPQIGR